MKKWTLEKQFRFEASHSLPDHDGKCARPHGHSWVMRIGVSSRSLIKGGPKAGMIIDYSEISEIVRPIIDQHLDHYCLNDSIPLHNPTSEAICKWMFDKIEPFFFDMPVVLEYVQVDETCTSTCRYGLALT